MAERDVTPVTVVLDRQRPYRVLDSDRDAVWVGPGEATVPRWVAEAWGMEVPSPTGDSAASEPWEGYDSLNVAQVLERLADAPEETQAAVLAYETATKARKGVLEALEA